MRQRLREARLRLVLQEFVHFGTWGALAGLVMVLAIRAQRWGALPGGVWCVAAVPVVFAAAAAWWRWRSWRRVAAEVDRRAGGKDRLVTVLAAGEIAEERFAGAVRREVAAFVAALSLRRCLRLRGPGRKALLLAVPLVGLAGLEMWREWRAERLRPELARAERLIEQARRAAAVRAEESKELQEIARELERTKEVLPNAAQPWREALRTLADLERKLSAAESALNEEEAAALAEALSASHPALAEKLRSGRNAEAAQEVEQMDPEAVAKALEEAARHRENSRLRELARQAAPQAQLVRVLRMSKGGSSGAAGRERFLADLRDIKNGELNEQGSPQDGTQGQGPPAPSQGKGQNTAASAADNAPPGGAPGSDKDLGRGGELAGSGDPAKAAAGFEESLAGSMGGGPSLVESFRTSGGDDPRASRAYREAWQAAASDALDAVREEQIPAGSRLLVKRYFEAIRPRE